MAMSTLELTSRANFLIYNYMKKQLNDETLAENFRKAIQEKSQKDIIIFKGLENLMTVLKSYYSLPGTASGDFASPTKAETPAAVATVVVKKEPEDPVPAQSNAALANGQKKKKKKQRKSELEQQASGSIPQPEPLAEVQQPAAEPATVTPDDSEQQEKKSKKKKKRRQSDAQEQPSEETLSDSVVKPEEQIEAVAVEAEPETEAPKPMKRKKERRNTDDAGADNIAETKSEAEDFNNGHSENGNELEDDGVATGSKGGKNKRHNQPFRRVREEEVVNKHFHDNSFDAKPGSTTGWGYKANEDLKPTQGRSFRHEKTKKKRGSYKGGAIDTGVSSFKFESDSE